MASQYDVAALMALFNMLKVNLYPESYRTMLSMLNDFDLKNTFIRKKIMKYIKLLIKDQMLLKCLLISLPEGVMNEPKPLPKAEKILLPPKIRHKKVVEGLDMQSQIKKQIYTKKFKQPLIATASCYAERLPDVSERPKHHDKQSEGNGSQSSGRCDETRRKVNSRPVSEQMRSPTSSLPHQHQSFHNRTMYPSIIGIPAGMAGVLPWQPINIMQSCYIGQLPSTSCHSGLLLKSTGDSAIGVDLTTKVKDPVKDSSETSHPDPSMTKLSNSQLLTVDVLSSGQCVDDRADQAIKTVSPCQDLRRGLTKEQESVSRRNSDCNSLKALAALTSHIGHDKSSMANERNHPRAKRSASTGSLDVQDESIAQSTIFTSVSKTSCKQNDRGDCNTNSAQSKSAVKSFPYSQEIKLPDGKYFLLNSSAERKVLSLKGDGKHEQISNNQNQNTVTVPGISVPKSATNHKGFHYKWYPISDSTRLLSKSHKEEFIHVSNTSDVDQKEGKLTYNTSDKLSQPPLTLNPGFGLGEKACKIHLDNESTTKLISELLRKRSRSESGLERGSSGQKKVRLFSDSQISAQTGQGDLAYTGVGPQLFVKIDNESVRYQHFPDISKPAPIINTATTTTIDTPTTPSAPIIKTEISKDVLMEQSYTKEKSNFENKTYSDLINTCISMSALSKSPKPTQREEILEREEACYNTKHVETNEKNSIKLTSPDILTDWDFLTHSHSSSSCSDLDDEVFDSVFL